MARQSKRQAEETPSKPPVPLFLGEPMSEMEDDEIENLASEPDEFDIFMDVGDKLTRAGDRITYTIKRDGEFIAGSVKHPFSWDRVQKDYGGGTFQVIARSVNQKGYVKSESRNVAAPTTDDVPDSSREESRGNSTNDLLMLLQAQKREEREELMRLEDRREQERREREEKADSERERREQQMKDKGDTTMMMMMKMMESQSAQTTALLTAMLSGNNNKKEDFSVEKIMQLMDTRMEKVISLVQGKDKTKDIDALKLIELQSQAEDRGYKRAMDLQTQAEKKAEELADMRESAMAPGPKEPSTTKMLLEALVPAAQSFMAMRGAPVSPLASPALPAVNPHTPAKPLPPAIKNQMMLRPPVPKNFKPAAPAAAPVAPTVAAQQEELTGMTKHEQTERVVMGEIGKDLSANMLAPHKLNPEGVADKVMEILKPFGITPDWLCSQYNVDAIMGIAKAKGVPEAIRPYIERFHAKIANTARVGLGESSKSI